MYMTKRFKHIISTVSIVLSMVIGLFIPTIAYAEPDHSGSVFINVVPQTSTGTISAYGDGAVTQNKLFAQDTFSSAEWKTTGIVFAGSSVAWNNQILDAVGGGVGTFPNGVYPLSGTTFSDGGDTFLEYASDNKWTASWREETFDVNSFFNTQTRILTMTVPGWTAGNDIWDPLSPGTILGSRDGDPSYEKIPADAGAAASSIIENLIGGFNEAMQYFNSYVTLSDGTKPDYDQRGLLNMMAHISRGEMPKAGSNVTYNPETATFTFNGGMAEVEIVGNPSLSNVERRTRQSISGEGGDTKRNVQVPASKSEIIDAREDGVVLAYMRVKGESGRNKVDNTMMFPYIVAKAPSITKTHFKGDVYALSFMDVTTSLAGSVYAGEGMYSDTGSNTSIVGDQINSFMYDMVTKALSIFGVKTADDLVFNSAGNLFKNNAYYLYIAIMMPFLVIAVMLLGTSIANNFRKSQLQYINTQQAGDIQSSVGNIGNALIQMTILPSIVRLLVYLDQVLVDMSITIHTHLNQLIGYQHDTRSGFWGTVGGFLSGSAMNILIVIAMAALNIKFTWRYIARSISFAMYFAFAPIQFAIDSFSGNGQILQLGQRSAGVWKNISSTILMRGVDAIGIVFATTIGRLLFGNGILVTLLGYYSISSITDAIRNSLGLANANIQGLTETGQKLTQDSIGVTKKAGAALGASALVGAGIGIGNEKNLMDAQQSAQIALNNKEKQRNATPGKTLMSTVSNGQSVNFGDEVSVSKISSDNIQTTDETFNTNDRRVKDTRTNLQNKTDGPSTASLYQDSGDLNSDNAFQNNGNYYSQTETGSFSQGGNVNQYNAASYEHSSGIGQSYIPEEDLMMTYSQPGLYQGSGYGDPSGMGYLSNSDNGVRFPTDNYDMAIDKMRTDPNDPKGHNYGLDAANGEIDPYLSDIYSERRGLRLPKDNQNIIDQYGQAINKNVDYSNSRFGRTRSLLDRLYGGFDAGARSGVALDPHTVKTSHGVGWHNKMKYSGPEHYGIDKNGNPVAKTWRARVERGSRMTAAALGGVASAFTPRNFATTAVTTGAIALAGMTDHKFDDVAVISAYGKHLESRRTGTNKGPLNSISHSIAGRMMGLDPNKMTTSRINTLSAQTRKSAPNQGPYTHLPEIQSRETGYEGSQDKLVKLNNGTVRKVSDFTNTIKGKEIIPNLQTITQDSSASKYVSVGANGQANITSQSMRDIINNPGSSTQAVRSAQNIMDEIETSGVDSMVYDTQKNQVGSIRDYKASENYDSETIATDSSLDAIRSNIQSNPESDGYFQSGLGDKVYRYDTENNSLEEYGSSYDTVDKIPHAYNRMDMRNELDRINTPESHDLANKLYSTDDVNEYNQYATEAQSMINNRDGASDSDVLDNNVSSPDVGLPSETQDMFTNNIRTADMNTDISTNGAPGNTPKIEQPISDQVDTTVESVSSSTHSENSIITSNSQDISLERSQNTSNDSRKVDGGTRTTSAAEQTIKSQPKNGAVEKVDQPTTPKIDAQSEKGTNNINSTNTGGTRVQETQPNPERPKENVSTKDVTKIESDSTQGRNLNNKNKQKSRRNKPGNLERGGRSGSGDRVKDAMATKEKAREEINKVRAAQQSKVENQVFDENQAMANRNAEMRRNARK